MLSLMFELTSILTTSFRAMKMKAPTRFQFILSICIIMIGTIYLINLYQLFYSATKWQDFGKMPITPQQILDFTPQTSVWIGYIEPETKSLFTCREAIAYLETKDQKTYRCCNSPER